MVEGLIEFTLSMFVCVCLCVFSFVCSRISSCMVGFENNLAQVIIMTRRSVANKNHFNANLFEQHVPSVVSSVLCKS